MESVENFAAVKEKIIKIDEVMQMCLQYKQKFIKIQQQSKLKVKNLSNDIKRLTIEKDRINFSLDTLKKKHDELTETHNRLKADHGSLEEKYSEQLLKNQRHVLEMEEKIKKHINKGIEQKQKNFKGKLSTLNKSENENKKEISRLTNLQNETLKEYELFKKSAAETEKILRHKCQELENDLLIAKNKLENYSCGRCHILTNEIGCFKETISHLKVENEFLQDSNKNKFLNLRDQTTQTDIQTEINAIKTLNESRNQFCNSQTQTIDVQDKQTENESNICDQCIMNQMLIPAMLTPLHETGYSETEYNHTLDMDMEIEEHINDYTELVSAEHNISFGNNITEEKTEKCVSDENNLPDLDYLNDENNLESIMQCCENNSVSDIDVNKQEFNDCKMSTETDPSLDNIETIEGIEDNLNTTMTDSLVNLLSPKKNNTQSDKKDADISDDREKKELLRRRDLKRKKRRLITNFRNYNEYRISNLFLKNNYNTKSSRRNSKNDILDAVLTLKKANIDFTISNRNARRIPKGNVNHYKLERKNSLRKCMEIPSEENNITKGLLKYQMSHKKQDQLDQLTKDFQDVCDSKMFNSKDLLEENEKLQKIIDLAQEIVKQKDAIINNKQQPTELIADIKIEDELDEKDEIVQIETSENIKTITQNSDSLKSEQDKKHELNSSLLLEEKRLPLEISQNDAETSVESKCSYSDSPTKAINNISTDSVSNFDLQNHSTPQKKVERNHNISLSTENLSPVSNKSDSDQSLLDKIFNDSQLIIPKLLSPISESSSKCKTNTTINNVSIDSQIVLPHMECVNLTALNNCSYVQRIVHELDSEFKAVKETENCDSIAEIVVNDSDKENIIEETENAISNDMDEQIFGPRNINLTNGIETESLTSDTKSEIENSFEPNNTEIFNTILNQSAILSNSAIKSLESNLNDSKCSDNSFLKKILSWKNTSLDDKLACTQIKKERGKQKHGERDLNVKKVNIVQNVVIKPANEKKCEEKKTNSDNSISKELDISNISTQNSAEQLNSVDELHVIKRKRGRPKKNVENFASVISHKVEGKDGPEQLISVNGAQVMKRKRGRPQNANDDVHKRKEAKLKRDSVLGENKCDIELNKLDNNVSETNLMVNSSANLSINNESSHKIKQTMDLDSKVKSNRMPILEAKERGTNKCNKLNNTSDMSDVVSEILTLMDRPVGHASPDIQSPVNTLLNDSKENSFDFDHPISPEPPCESFDMPRIIPLERPSRIPPAQVKQLFEKLIMFPNEKEILDEVVVQLVGQDSEYLAKLILVMVLRDLTEKPDNSQDQCAPPLTLWQKIAVGLIIRLDKTNGGNIQDIFLFDVQAYIFSKRADLRQTIDLTRTFTTLCRARKDINKMRVFCCDAFYFMDNLAVPIFFTVLTCWSEVIPNYKDSKDYALARVLAQLSITKAFNIKGYSLMSLKRLLIHFYEYPKELDNNEFFNDIFNAYSKYPSKNNDQAIILFCKHQPDKWILSQIDGKFKPLVHKINSINFKATIIVLLGKIFKNFKDVTLLNETTMWLNSLKNDLNSEVIARAVKYSLMRISR